MFCSKIHQSIFFIVILTLINSLNTENLEYCEKPIDNGSKNENCKSFNENLRKRYILYDANPLEGFNLRRDIYVRIAAFVKKINDLDDLYEWNLVLPPWGRMYHWRSKDLGSQNQLFWANFFDVSSLKKYIPVLEIYDFFKEYNLNTNEKIILDRVYVLKNDPKMFESGDFKDKNELTECDENSRYQRIGKNEFSGHFWGYSNITAKDVKCVIFHGTAFGLRENLDPRTYRSFMFDRMEIPLHDEYGSKEYWKARRSMRYNRKLYEIATNFRLNYLNSEDSSDRTQRPDDWTKEKRQRNAIGGPYLAVHLRRRDFLTGRSNHVPNIKNAAEQLKKKMNELDLKILFVATDAENSEYEELKSLLKNYEVHRYVPSISVKKQFKDGGVAIIDQIICSHARYFIGTHESTFTFRIQEDREIIGFPSETTFNRLCGKEKKCLRGSEWKIVW